LPGWSHPSHGSSQSFDYYFTTAVTSGDYTQGEAHQWALREMYTNGLWYMEYYEMFEWGALWGNPNLGMASVDVSDSPGTPDTPSGDSEGDVDVEYMFTTSTIDPNSDQIYYCFSWGDGQVEWIGPYDSGEIVQASHIWGEQGEFEVKVKAQDIYGAESDWSDPLYIEIIDPFSIEIKTITGGFGVHATIKNTGAEDIVDLEYTIALNGSLIFIGEETKEFVDISVGDEVKVSTGFVFGLGKIDITVNAMDEEMTSAGFVFGPFVFNTT